MVCVAQILRERLHFYRSADSPPPSLFKVQPLPQIIEGIQAACGGLAQQLLHRARYFLIEVMGVIYKDYIIQEFGVPLAQDIPRMAQRARELGLVGVPINPERLDPSGGGVRRSGDIDAKSLKPENVEVCCPTVIPVLVRQGTEPICQRFSRTQY